MESGVDTDELARLAVAMRELGIVDLELTPQGRPVRVRLSAAMLAPRPGASRSTWPPAGPPTVPPPRVVSAAEAEAEEDDEARAARERELVYGAAGEFRGFGSLYR